MKETRPAGAKSVRETVGRFAPTPSGRMHLGNLFSCLIAWLAARSEGGRVVLRMEDLDTQRTSREYARQIEEDLLLLGLDWDEGGSLGGPHGPYWQSQRGEYYEACLEKLREKGLVYQCFCSRAQLHAANAPHASDGDYIYSGKCRGLTESQIREREQERPAALRMAVFGKESLVDRHYGLYEQDLPKECGDFILRRSDGVFAYQLAVVADDLAMGVTQVVRGRDLLSSAPRQIQLCRLLGGEPPEYGHVPMLLAPDGRRLSKRERDMSLDVLLEKGMRPEDILGWLAHLAGLIDRPQGASARELIKIFDWKKLPKTDIPLPALDHHA